MSYRVALENFEGPLDLLLFLIKKNEVDIHDIPIAKITQQYLEYLQILDKILAVPRNQMRLSYQIAAIYAALEDKNKAFEWLEVAYQQKHDFLLDIKVDQKLDNLRSDPRFTQLLKKVGLDSW